MAENVQICLGKKNVKFRFLKQDLQFQKIVIFFRTLALYIIFSIVYTMWYGALV